jgi:CheY-like chemotaxis protein
MTNKRKIIFTADDDADDLFFFREAIKDFDPSFKVVTARNGGEALHALQKFTPDIIFLDINMPVMDGFKCLQIIRTSMKHLDSVCIAILTTSNLMYEQAMSLGANFYFVKPVLQEEWNEIFAEAFSVLHEAGHHH